MRALLDDESCLCSKDVIMERSGVGASIKVSVGVARRCRYPQYNAVRFTFTLLFAFLLATAFWRVGMHR